jgi:hypothetical protein
LAPPDLTQGAISYFHKPSIYEKRIEIALEIRGLYARLQIAVSNKSIAVGLART